MKYKDTILFFFKKLNLLARLSQLEIINNVLTLFLDNNKKYVVLSAPTGSGKSIIAVVIAECLKYLTALKHSLLKTSYILMHNKALQHQYFETFKNKDEFANIMGAGNYECKLMKGTGLDCVVKGIYNQNNKFLRLFCHKCKYRESRLALFQSPHVITNYSFYFIMGLQRGILKNRLLTVYDESHLINDIFCSHMLIRLTAKVVELLLSLLDKYPCNKHDQFLQQFNNHRKLLQSGKLNLSNYIDFLDNFYKTISGIITEYLNIVDDLHLSGDIETCKAYKKIVNRFTNLHSKYLGLIEYEYLYTIDFKLGIALQPIFVGKVFGLSENSLYSLFMSATNQLLYIVKTLLIDESKAAFVKAKPIFKPLNKLVAFVNHCKYNYKNLSLPNTIKLINELVYSIIDLNKHQSGVILTPSFKINLEIVKYVTKRILNVNILYQLQGKPIAAVLDLFKFCTKPSVLISPSLWLGISLDDDVSRYQIIIKAPYLNLGEKRIKHILDNYPSIYQIQTLFKLIQGMGRSTRSVSDYSVSYCLDSNCKMLFNSKYNVWKDLFSVQDI